MFSFLDKEMAKIYLQPINLPEGITVSIDSDTLNIKGKLGDLTLKVPSSVEILQDDSSIAFKPEKGLSENFAITGTMRALTSNLIQGVHQGYEKKLEINGVGYRAKIEGKKLELSLGYSHPVIYELPEGVSAELPSQTEITLKSIDKQLIGQVAAEIRNLRPPEPYKGKGVKYADERIKRKESKKA